MKRILTIVSVLTLVMAAGAQAEDYGWSLSFSSTDGGVNTQDFVPSPGQFFIYLWLDCTLADGMSAAEFDVTPPAAYFGHAFTPLNGVLNAGNANNLLLAVGGCPTGPFLAGQFGGYINLFGNGGAMCLDGARVTVDCALNPSAHPSAVNGSADDSSEPCVVGECSGDAVEDASWGSIKGLYR